MRIDARRAFVGLLIAGVAGGFLFLPAIVYIGTFFVPSPIAPATAHTPTLIADALWARANGGRATELEQLNPFTLGRMASCHVLAELREPAERDAQHEECMKLLPGIEAVGYVSNLHLQSVGVWQDPRVPFAGFATMTRVTDKWTRQQLVDTLAERAEYAGGTRGVEQAAQRFFGKPAAALTLPEAALIGAMTGDGHLDPWCNPAAAARSRQHILEKMRDNEAIDDAALDAAAKSDLGITGPLPEGHKPCDP